MRSVILRTLVRAWLLTALVDWIYATTMPVVAYGASLGRVWLGVASVLLGPSAMQGGARTMLVGTLMHLGVAIAWTALFLALALLLPALRRLVATTAGAVAAAAVYGPLIWVMMSLVIIPRFTGHMPTINGRWWVTLVAHVPFVAIPMVLTIGRGLREIGDVAPAPVVEGAV